MSDAGVLRERMIATLRERGILHGDAIERAFRDVPRHLFLPEVEPERAYTGDVIPTKRDANGVPISSSSEVAVMVCMLEMLDLAAGQRVLEIGAGTGYNAAVVAALVGDDGEVTTIEIDDDVADEARVHLANAGFDRVRVVTSDGWTGHPVEAPYDRIIVTASTTDIPPAWVAQLAPDGRIVLPLRTPAGVQTLLAFRRDGARLVSVDARAGGFMALRGPSVRLAPAFAIGDFDVEPAARAAPHRDALEALLSEPPCIESGPALRWSHYAFIALSEPLAVGVRRHDAPRFGVGIFDPDARGLALVEMAGSPLDGPATRVVSYGSGAVAARLRRHVAELVAVELRDVRVIAEPNLPGLDASYRFTVEHAGTRVA